MIISIVTPSFNQGQFIRETIESILKQKGDFLIDYIVMDGSSSDETVEILKQTEAEFLTKEIILQDSQLNFRASDYCKGVSFRWFSEKDRGQTNAINKGWAIAKGDIWAWLNSDDIYLPGALAEVAAVFGKQANTKWLYGIGMHIDRSGKFIEIYPSESFTLSRLKEYCFICQPTVFLRKDIILNAGWLDENLNYVMDYEYWLRLANKNHQPAFLQQVLACTRLYEETKTLSNPTKILAEIFKLEIKMFNCISEHWLFTYVSSLRPRKLAFLRQIIIWIYFIYLSLYYNKKIPDYFFIRIKNKFKKGANNTSLNLKLPKTSKQPIFFKSNRYIPFDSTITTLIELDKQGFLSRFLCWNDAIAEANFGSILNAKVKFSDEAKFSEIDAEEFKIFQKKFMNIRHPDLR